MKLTKEQLEEIRKVKTSEKIKECLDILTSFYKNGLFTITTKSAMEMIVYIKNEFENTFDNLNIKEKND